MRVERDATTIDAWERKTARSRGPTRRFTPPLGLRPSPRFVRLSEASGDAEVASTVATGNDDVFTITFNGGEGRHGSLYRSRCPRGKHNDRDRWTERQAAPIVCRGDKRAGHCRGDSIVAGKAPHLSRRGNAGGMDLQRAEAVHGSHRCNQTGEATRHQERPGGCLPSRGASSNGDDR